MSNYAKKTKEDLENVEVEDEFGPIQGSFEPIVTHYTLTTPKIPRENVKQLLPGQAVIGEYAGSYIEPSYGKVKHRVRTADGLVTLPGGLPGTGQLNKALSNIEDGGRFRALYEGMSEMTKGKNAGAKAHSWAVTFSKFNTK